MLLRAIKALQTNIYDYNLLLNTLYITERFWYIMALIFWPNTNLDMAVFEDDPRFDMA